MSASFASRESGDLYRIIGSEASTSVGVTHSTTRIFSTLMEVDPGKNS